MNENLYWHRTQVSRADREQANGHRAALVWFTGLSGSGKSTLAHAIEKQLFDHGCKTCTLDGDNIRHGLCADLDFSAAGRRENIRRIGELARLFIETGVITLAAFVSPYRADRDALRERVGCADFVEVYCCCPLNVCEQRDVKGVYRRARLGEIKAFTGISAPYEEPLNPELTLNTGQESLETCAARVIDYLAAHGIVPRLAR